MIVIFGLLGCSSLADSTTENAGLPLHKTGASAIRYDIEAIEHRFPKLPTGLTGEWVHGFYGDIGPPGPETVFWVDAILEIPPEQLTAFVAPYSSSLVAAARPQLWPTLISGVSATSFSRSNNLDRALSTKNGTDGWEVKAYVPESNSVLVVIAQGRDLAADESSAAEGAP